MHSKSIQKTTGINVHASRGLKILHTKEHKIKRKHKTSSTELVNRMVLLILHMGLSTVFVMHIPSFYFRRSFIRVHQLTITDNTKEVHDLNDQIRL